MVYSVTQKCSRAKRSASSTLGLLQALKQQENKPIANLEGTSGRMNSLRDLMDLE